MKTPILCGFFSPTSSNCKNIVLIQRFVRISEKESIGCGGSDNIFLLSVVTFDFLTKVSQGRSVPSIIIFSTARLLGDFSILRKMGSQSFSPTNLDIQKMPRVCVVYPPFATCKELGQELRLGLIPQPKCQQRQSQRANQANGKVHQDTVSPKPIYGF